jgi:hypothetical protein
MSHAHNHIHRIIRVFLRFNHENRTMIRAVAHIISTVQKSGINRKIAYSNALSTMNVSKNCGLFIFSFFLVNRLAKNITYANLKNSEGWILGI